MKMTFTKSAQSALLTIISMLGAGLANYYNQPNSVKIVSIVVAAIFGLLHIHSPATNVPGTGTTPGASSGSGSAGSAAA